MAARRLLFSLSRARPAPTPALRPRQYPLSLLRFNSSSSSSSSGLKHYTFSDLQSFTASPSPHRLIIDVREPSEYSAGAIPGAINLPLASAPEALSMPEDEFEDRFGFPKPDKSRQEVVFYCKAGIRSKAAAQLAREQGYQKVAEYPGSWLDWEKQRDGEAS